MHPASRTVGQQCLGAAEIKNLLQLRKPYPGHSQGQDPLILILTGMQSVSYLPGRRCRLKGREGPLDIGLDPAVFSLPDRHFHAIDISCHQQKIQIIRHFRRQPGLIDIRQIQTIQFHIMR